MDSFRHVQFVRSVETRKVVGQALGARPVVDGDPAAFALRETTEDDAFAEGSSLRLHVPVAGAIGEEGAAVEDVDGARLAYNLRIFSIEASHFYTRFSRDFMDGRP